MEVANPVLMIVINAQMIQPVRPVLMDMVSWMENVLDAPQRHFCLMENALPALTIARSV